MSVGLDALNKLQRMRAEDAAARSAMPLPRAAQPKSSVNGLLVVGIIVSLLVAAFALFHGHHSSTIVVASGSGGAAATTAIPAAYAPPPPAPAAAPHPATGNPLIESFVAACKLGGVDDGSSGGKPLVMVNDRIFHLYEIVNIAYGLQVAEIRPNRITFRDSRGNFYYRYLTAN